MNHLNLFFHYMVCFRYSLKASWAKIPPRNYERIRARQLNIVAESVSVKIIPCVWNEKMIAGLRLCSCGENLF